ncbi:putative 2-dehydropantoate 2-reductase [Diplodia seriata]|uniref:Putative 2-dehydropantoate 2-reductase n=1 Tax=Diplodia seriata TaxID=420778 RepID=A0A0G2GWA3_9PEZI|nr:putative 2-dehydropantoate 2-reductase [Diplodia seriata]
MSTSESGDGRPIHILFVGAGAVGCFYASRLHHPTKNIHVSLVCRSNYPTIAASGVTLETRAFGLYTFTPHAVFPSISAAAAATSPWDYVIVTTKALPDVTDDSADIAPLVDAETCVVLIQNGVGIEGAHRARFPRNPIVSAVTVISAEQLRHGYVRQNRWTRISMVHLFNDLGGLKDAEAHTELELQQIRWHKLTINAAMNPSAILSGGRGNADMVLDADLREHLRGVMQEIWDAAPRYGEE